MITPLISNEDMAAAMTAKNIAYQAYYQASRTGINYREAHNNWVRTRDYAADLKIQFQIQNIGSSPCVAH
jgi:hypothetical protein